MTQQRLRTGGLVLLVAFLFTLPLWMPAYYLTTSTRILFYSMLGISLAFLAGQGGMISLAQTALFGFSAYVVAILSIHHGYQFPIPELAAILATTAVALVAGMITSRTYDTYYLMITLALGQIAWAVAQQWTSMTEGFDGIQGGRAPVVAGISFNERDNFYWALLVVFLIAFLVFRRISKSSFGIALRGVRENPGRMAALGYPVYWIRVAAFGMAGVLASIAGVFFVEFTGIITPTTVSLDRTVWLLLAVILGGVNSLIGPVIGVIIALWFEVTVSRYTDRYLTVMGITFVLIVLFAPNGVMGVFNQIKRRYAQNGLAFFRDKRSITTDDQIGDSARQP